MFVAVNGCQLFFDTYGSALSVQTDCVQEKVTILMIHGGPGIVDHTMYVEFWSRFSDVAQVVFLDQRGCGRSERSTPENWTLKQWADDIAEFCKILGIHKPIIAGVSMGGHVMCEYATRYPDQPGGLIFCNTEARVLLDEVCQKFKTLGGDQAADAAQRHLTSPDPESNKDYLQHCVPHYAKHAYTPAEIARCIQNLDVFYHYYKNFLTKFNYLAALSVIQCPTLLMTGELSPLHLSARAEEMRAAIKPTLAQLHFFKEAGAPVYKDSPQEAEEVVRGFLKGLSTK